MGSFNPHKNTVKQDQNNLHFTGGKRDIKNNLSKITELVTGRVNHSTLVDKR